MDTLVVSLFYDLPHPGRECLVHWGELLAEHDGSVAFTPGHGITVTLWLDGRTLAAAVPAAAELANPIVGAEPVGAEVVTEREHLRRGDAPTLPEVLSAPEVADLLQVSRQRVHQLRANPGFPAPLYELRTGPIWAADAVRAFAATWERRAGRPIRA